MKEIDQTTQNERGQFVETASLRFRQGLTRMLTEESDTFAFEFDSNEVESGAVSVDGEPSHMTLIVLIRPKELADPMLEAIEAARAGQFSNGETEQTN